MFGDDSVHKHLWPLNPKEDTEDGEYLDEDISI